MKSSVAMINETFVYHLNVWYFCTVVKGSGFLCAACTEGHRDIVQMLLDEPYNVNPDKDYKNEVGIKIMNAFVSIVKLPFCAHGIQ